MDRVDLAIFSRLVTDALASDESIARQVGLTGKAVRTRRRRMEAVGVLTEYGIHPAAEIVGRHARTWRFRGREWRELPTDQLLQVGDLAYVMRFRPDFYVVVRFVADPRASTDPRLSRIFGPPVHEVPDPHPSTPTIGPEDLTRVDWRVLEAVVENPRASYSWKAKQAKTSPRTFRIHQTRLEGAGALGCVVMSNLEREAGLATYGIWLQVDESFDPHAVELPRLWDRPHWTEHPRGVYLLGSAENYFAAREVELRLRSLPGVTGADPLIPAGGFFARDRLLEWIRAARQARFPS